MKSFAHSLVAFALSASALATPFLPAVRQPPVDRHGALDLSRRQEACPFPADSKRCWKENWSVNTSYYDDSAIPPPGPEPRVYYLSVVEGNCAPDGFSRPCMTLNGTVPGPVITADWGEEVVVHVTNNLENNGTAIHWHGLHMKGSVEYDGVPGVTQCPITPGRTMTYKFRATQYGTTWYHSHFSLQYADGIFGPIVINGPTTDEYDIDLGTVFLQDWGHETAWHGWEIARRGAGPDAANGLINGTNIFCPPTQPNCANPTGRRFETVFTPGRKHKIRLINSSNDAHFRFSIDGHTLKVVANDLVPIVPYDTDEVLISIGQRYDVIVEGKTEAADLKDYWLRSGMDCTPSGPTGPDFRELVKGVVRYDAASTAVPDTTPNTPYSGFCGDEDITKLRPWIPVPIAETAALDNVGVAFNGTLGPRRWAQWLLNSSSLVLDWKDPTLEMILDGRDVFPTPYNVISIDKRDPNARDYYVLVIRNPFFLDHPIHMHGHDFSILAQSNQTWDGTTRGFNFANAARRDTAWLPANGHLAIAFELDNPGVWLVHCHIAWHASQGLSLEFVESQDLIPVRDPNDPDYAPFRETCEAWDQYTPTMPYPQDDSGI